MMIKHQKLHLWRGRVYKQLGYYQLGWKIWNLEKPPAWRTRQFVISKAFRPHVVHVYKQSMHMIRVKPSSCHTWLAKEAHVWTKCDLVESCDKMIKICHIFNTWSWPLYLSVTCWRKDKQGFIDSISSLHCTITNTQQSSSFLLP